MLACAGDIPTLETLAAAAVLRDRLPELKVRFVNVVDLMRLQDETEHPHGLTGAQFDALFTADRPVIFAYHGYPWLIHRLTYRRTNHRNLHVRGYKEEGTTTTPFDNVMLNDMDRYHLVMDVIDRVPGLGQRAAGLRQEMVDERLRKRAYTPASTATTQGTFGIGSGRSSPRHRIEQPQAASSGCAAPSHGVRRRSCSALASCPAAAGPCRRADGARAPRSAGPAVISVACRRQSEPSYLSGVARLQHVDAPAGERAAVSLPAPVVLERDTEPDTKIHDGAVLDRQVLAHDLGHP